MPVPVNVPQGKFLALDTKFRAFVGGFGSGKTAVGCIAQCMDYWEYPKINQGYFAPTYPQIRDIFYPTIDEVAHWMGLRVEVRSGDKEVHFYEGRRYRGTTICRSMERPETIIGFKIGRALVDELDVMTKEKSNAAWNKIIARMRYLEANNSIDVTTTPEGFKFVYERFKEQGGQSYGMVQASTYDNEENLPPDYIDSLIETYPQELIDAYLNGQFVNLTSGTVYYAYNRVDNDSSEEVVDGDLLRIGMDFNVGNMSACIYVLRGDTWHMVNELSGIFDTPAMIQTIKQKWPLHSIRVYPDASGKNRKSVDASTSDIALLEMAGFAVYANKSNPFVKDRVLASNKAFQNKRVMINQRNCPESAKCLEQLAYDGNGEPDKKSNLDHLPDAATYPIAFEMPIDKPAAKLKLTFAR
jgi:hypothetical protein